MHADNLTGFSKWYVDVTVPLIFHKRGALLSVLLLITAALAWQASQLRLDAGFEKMLPLDHPYIQVFKQYEKEFGGANLVLLAIKQNDDVGDIYQADFMQTLRDATDSIFFLPGMDRSRVSSIMTPDVRFLEVMEYGFRGGNVVPADFQATPDMLEQVRKNVAKAGIIGRLVSNDQTGAMIFGELLEKDPISGKKLDYFKTADRIEAIRQRFISPLRYEFVLKKNYESLSAGSTIHVAYEDPRGAFFNWKNLELRYQAADDSFVTGSFKGSDLEIRESANPDYNPNIDIHVIGFAKIMGDVANHAGEVVGYFALTIFLVWIVLWLYTGSPVISLLPLSCALLAVVWELGLLHLLGFGLDPFAILVPFLVVAISISHGIQITSFWLLEAAEKSLSSFDASMSTYKRLVVPGITALITNVVGFATLMLIPVGIVQEMAINASLGLIAVVVCKKILLPCLLSFAPIKDPRKFQAHQFRRDRMLAPIWRKASYLTHKPVALIALLAVAATWGWAEVVKKDLAIGELHAGTPELRPDSRYNKDTDAIVENFAIGVDVLKIIGESEADSCIQHEVIDTIDRLSWHLQNTPGVQSTLSLPKMQKLVYNSYNEANPKWNTLPRDSGALVVTVQPFPSSTGLLNEDCSAIPLFVFTADHKATTIDEVIASFHEFNDALPPESPISFKLATGNVGVMAATNEVVRDTEPTVLFWLYLCIGFAVFLSFGRTLVSVICILTPLVAVSVITYAVMVFLEIGVKVSNIATVAFAAGVGVDYGIYIYSILEENVKQKGMAMREAYENTLHQTGKAVVFTALALAASVATWMMSGLQFQVDMGILLTIMFVANAVAAIIMLPAFATFLLKAPKDQQGAQQTEPEVLAIDCTTLANEKA